ncbi:MAG: hypothetical protein V3T49_08900 [Dehalococcoidia bacterium]
MTTRAGHKNEQNFDIDAEDGVDDEVELSAGKKLLSAAAQVADLMRRTTVFGPVFGLAFLAIGFLWFQSVQAENSLEARTESLQILLDQPAPQPDLLLQQADGWDTAYIEVMSRRTARPTASDLIGQVIGAAVTAGLVVVETGTTDDGEATIEGEKYTVTPILLKTNGTLSGIERFLAILETPEFSAFEIQASMLNAETVGYQLTLKGIFYSLPESFANDLLLENGEAGDHPVIPVTAVSSTDKLEVAP